MFDWVHPALADPVSGRHHAARTADRPVLQDGTERPRRGARCTQLSVPGVPWQAGTDDPALSRPEGLRAGRQQSVARSADAVRQRTGQGSADDPAAEQVPVHPAAGGSGSGPAGGAVAAGCCARAGAGATRAVPAAGAAERATARRRRCPSTRRRIRWCRRTAGLRRMHLRRRRAARRRRATAARGGTGGLGAPPRPPRRRRGNGPEPWRRTTRAASSSTPPVELACSLRVLTNWRLRRIGLI